jgi:beta-lactamase induction signal transducer ampG
MGGRSKRMHHTTMRPFTIPHPPFQEQSRMKANQPSPWMWIPTLYFAEGIPYFIVNSISVTMFTKMGVPNGEMALFTSLLYLPWTIKPLWSPFVDILKTKRWWILSMQILMSVAFILTTLSIPHPDAATITSQATPISLFTFTLILFIVTAFASATHDIAADGFYMLALNQQQQSFFVGIRSTFYRLSSIFGQGVLVYIAGYIERTSHDIPLSWTLTMAITSVIFTLISLYHTFVLPKPKADGMRHIEECQQKQAQAIWKEFARTFVTFIRKPGVLLAIVFMLLYRLPEAFLLKMVNPFLLDSQSKGGLALATDEVGIIYGTIGVFFLTLGGIIGGVASSRWGLKKALWPMALFMTLPCATFVYMSMFHPTNVVIISTCVAIEQFGYGFGFTAYMLYMMYFSEGEFTTAHYAICTAFMALSMMIPGMFAGYLQEWLGYEGFFWMVMVCCVATVAVTIVVRKEINANYGRKVIEKK